MEYRLASGQSHRPEADGHYIGGTPMPRSLPRALTGQERYFEFFAAAVYGQRNLAAGLLGVFDHQNVVDAEHFIPVDLDDHIIRLNAGLRGRSRR